MEQQQIQFNWADPEGSADMELRANEARIAELRARLESLGKQGLASANELDRNLAANRARVGDLGTAQAHLGRIESRIAADDMRKMQERMNSLNKIRDVQYRYAQLKSKVDQLETDYANTTPDNIRAFRNAEAKVNAAKAELKAFERQNGAFLFGGNSRDTVGVTQEPRDWGEDTPETVQQVKTQMDECTMKGDDGNLYLKRGCKEKQEKILRDARSLKKNGEMPDKLQELINDFEKLREVPEAKAANNTENLSLWLQDVANFRNGAFVDGRREELQKMYDAMSLEEQKSPKGVEIKNHLEKTPEISERKAYLAALAKAMDREGWEMARKNLHVSPGEKFEDSQALRIAKESGFTDSKGNRWTWKDSKWKSDSFKFGKSLKDFIKR